MGGVRKLTKKEIETMYAIVDEIAAEEDARSESILKDLNKSLEYVKEKQKLIEKLQYEIKVINKDILDLFKNRYDNCSYNLFRMNNSEIFYNAFLYFNREKGEEINEDHKAAFYYVTELIKRNIFSNSNEFKLKDIMIYNYQDGYCFYYQYKDVDLEIEFPNYQSATEKNLFYMLGGLIIRYKESELIWQNISNNLNYKIVVKEFNKWLKERFKKK